MGSAEGAVALVRQRPVVVSASAVVLVLVMIAGSLLRVRTADAVAPRVVEGWAMPNASGTAISLHQSDTGGPGEGYIVAGASWVGVDDVWHSGAQSPTCIGDDPSSTTAVRLSAVSVALEDGTREDHVVHLRCLS